MNRILSVLILLGYSTTAQAADAPKKNAYATVMAAQYAAHAPTVAQRSEEAQRVYDAYLKSIGQKSKDSSDGSVDGDGTQPH